MKYTHSSSAVLLAHMSFGISSSHMKYFYAFLAVMSLFVFGLLLFRKFVRTPKGLFISSFISYVLVLINILQLSFDLRVPKVVGYLCFAVGIWPSCPIVYSLIYPMEVLTERLFGSWITFDETIILYLVSFGLNTLGIFAIIRLILYIKHKVSAQKPHLEEIK
jgi:hypothetical protein